MSDTTTKPLHVLVLGRLEGGDALSDWVEAHARVEHVDTVEAALESLKAEPFDVVLTTASDFIPLKDLRSCDHAATMLDNVDQGLCIVGEDGDFVWTNPKMLGFPEEVRDRVSRCGVETYKWASAQVRGGSRSVRGRRFSLSTADNKCFEVNATPVIDLNNHVTQVACVVWDATRPRRLQAKIDAIDQAGRELVRLDADQFSRLDTEQRLSLFEQKILRCTKDLLHFDNFAIFVVNRLNKHLEMLLSFGMPAEVDHMELLTSTDGNGITGYVAATGKSYICPDVSKDPRYIQGIHEARSSLTVPLRLHDRIVGVGNFESIRPGAFHEDDRQFAEIFGRYVAIALHILELLDTERFTTTGRVGSCVLTEITGPLNDILTEAEGLIEDYIGHDDLRLRLRKLSENAVMIRESIGEVTSGRRGILGARSAGRTREDPVLNGKTVLIADDEDVIRETIRDVLGGYGCLVTTVSDGAAAVQEIASAPFDLVLSDIKMPKRSGYEVFAAAKEANPATPVILMTGFGYDPNHSIVRARREGLAAVLFKPFKVDQLLGEIRSALKSLKP